MQYIYSYLLWIQPRCSLYYYVGCSTSQSGSGSEAEGDEEGRVSRSTGRRGGVSEQPAWRDEDDDEIRSERGTRGMYKPES